MQKFESEADDVLGSLNIKRALAAMFQLKLGSLGRPSFVAQEVRYICSLKPSQEKKKRKEFNKIRTIFTFT